MEKQLYYKLSEEEYEKLYCLINNLKGYLNTDNILEYDEIFKQIFNIIKENE